jgi:hypothetical protein
VSAHKLRDDVKAAAALKTAREYLADFMSGNDADLSERLARNSWMMSGIFRTRREVVPGVPGFFESFEREDLTREIDLDRVGVLIAKAKRGDVEADLSLRGAIAELLRRGSDVPAALAGYAADALMAESGFHIPNPVARNLRNRGRDLVICMTVKHIMQTHGLKFSRGPGVAMPSACAIVAEAGGKRLNITEEGVAQTYRRKHGLRGFALMTGRSLQLIAAEPGARRTRQRIHVSDA